MSLFICPHCQQEIPQEQFESNLKVCEYCGYHAKLTWQERLRFTLDAGSFVELDPTLRSENPLDFPGYEKKIDSLGRECETPEAVVTGYGTLLGYPVAIGVMDSRFMMGSMGSVVGEKISRLFEYGTGKGCPVILFCASGGARMQEGIFSLMQMAKTSGALGRHRQAGQLYLSVLTDPTTGGVTASFASLGDIILAEPGVLVGFAGMRVIQDTIGGGEMPDDFQSAEFLLRHGFVDLIVPREELKKTLSRLLRLLPDTRHTLEAAPAAASVQPTKPQLSVSQRLGLLHRMGRPSIYDYIPLIFEDFVELHGDRYYGDDPAIIGGVGIFQGTPVMLISQVRGRNIEELQRANFSMPHPEGYRKALRLAKLAEKFHCPIICGIDTLGAFCGIGAEERGQGEAIARNLMEFMALKTPVVSLVMGEGGSGGALALGVCDELAMLENALYSVISPRGFASILWKDAAREKEAAELMKIGAEDLSAFGICDRIIPEPEGGAQQDIPLTARNISTWLSEALSRLCALDINTLLENRYAKFRRIGVFSN